MGSLRVLTDPSESDLKLLDYPRHGKEEHKPLRVYGKYVLDSAWNKVLLRGLQLSTSDVTDLDIRLTLTQERFRQIRSWGFNVVRITLWWGVNIEPNEAQPGVWNETHLTRVEDKVKRAEKAGLYFIITPRVSYSDTSPAAWQGWPRHYHLFDATYRARYCRMLEMLVDRFDKYWNVMFCPWHFPFHGTTPTDKQRSDYYSVVTPEIVNAIRRKTDKIIFWSPIQIGLRAIAGVDRETGEYNYISPLTDKNIVYQYVSYRATGGTIGVSHDPCNAWDYNEGELETHLSYGVSFQETHDVPMCVGEFGLQIHSGAAACQLRPVMRSRLDWLRTKMKLYDKYGHHWLYWAYTRWTGVSEPFGLFETDVVTPVFEMVQALQRLGEPRHEPLMIQDQIAFPLFYMFQVGTWIDPLCTGQYLSTATDVPADTLRCHTFLIQRRMRFDRIGCNVAGAGAAGALARLGVYSCNPNTFYPTTLVLDAGAVDCTTTGDKELTIDLTLDRGLYFLAINTNDATIDLSYRPSAIPILCQTVPRQSFTGYYVAQAYGALPDPYPAGALLTTWRVPMLRVAELL